MDAVRGDCGILKIELEICYKWLMGKMRGWYPNKEINVNAKAKTDM